MPRCLNYDSCPFLKKYGPEFGANNNLKERALHYCESELNSECIRKKISKTLGDAALIPVNMMPEGEPVPGTHIEEWSAVVTSLLEKYK
ncbi:MAG: hypothetical protein PHP13_03130 [Methanomicrobium sp.]|nr:hypothetical protein [Methanomicrobium sp.]MDD4299553.1 hypothetical protein [Methanomicrobium sp.]